MSISFLPIILFFVALFLISNLIKRQVNSYGKSIKWMLAGYVAILLIAAGVFFLIPTDDNLTQEENMINYNYPYLYQKADNGEINEIEPSYIREQWEFPYEGNQLKIEESVNEGNGVNVFVEKIDDMKGKVEITFYQTPSFVENTDITSQIPSPSIDLSSNVLTIHNPESYDITISTFKNPFPVRQFTGDKIMNEETIKTGQQILYIRIPEQLKLDYDSFMTLEYVRE